MSNPIVICIIFLGFSPDFLCIFLGSFAIYNFGLGGELQGVTARQRAAVDEKIEHTSLGDLLSSCAGLNLDEMRACQSV